jgi:pimeloyl-ACP methyl ester carboxylesterase
MGMAQDFDVATRRGRLRVRQFGRHVAVSTICVPGLASNSRVFDALGEYREARGAGIVAVDLRGRGWSEITPPGTYGWDHHAADLFDVADALEIERFNIVGHSMGAFVAMTAAALPASARIARMVLIDGLGVPEQSAIAAIVAGLARLRGTFVSPDAYVEAVRSAGLATPWNAYWDRHYRYDLVHNGDGVRPRTDARAVGEDTAYGAGRDVRALWPGLTQPLLVIRASLPLGAPGGFVVPRSDYDAFLHTHPNARGVEVAANHYGVVIDAATLAAIDEFLS